MLRRSTFDIIILHSKVVQEFCNILKAASKTLGSCVLLTSSICLLIKFMIACRSETLLGDFLGPDPATELVNGNV